MSLLKLFTNVHRLRKLNQWLRSLQMRRIMLVYLRYLARLLLPRYVKLRPHILLDLFAIAAIVFLVTLQELLLNLRRRLVQCLARLLGQRLLKFVAPVIVHCLLVRPLCRQLPLARHLLDLGTLLIGRCQFYCLIHHLLRRGALTLRIFLRRNAAAFMTIGTTLL